MMRMSAAQPQSVPSAAGVNGQRPSVKSAAGNIRRTIDEDEAPEPAHPASERARRGSPRPRLVAGDVLALAVAWTLPTMSAAGIDAGRRLACGVAVMGITLLIMRQEGLYRSRVCALRTSEVQRSVVAALIGGGAFVGGTWLAGSPAGSPAVGGASAAALLVVVHRWHFGRWLKERRSRRQYLRTIVLVGTNDVGGSLLKMFRDEPELGYRVGAVVGSLCWRDPWTELPGSTCLDDLIPLASLTGATGIVIVDGALGATACAEAVDMALKGGLHVQIWPGLHGLSTRRVHVVPTSGLPFLYVEPARAGKCQLLAKRVMDVVLAAVICPFALPVLAAAAIWIKLDDGGPIIYRHEVVGRHGARITVLKLRTMVTDAACRLPELAGMNERKGGPLFKASNDPRVTRAGRFLRETSIDELPQLWNVFNGTMSLVGPRFALQSEAAHFDPELQRRHEMRPGMTGLWQSEARDNPSFSAYRRLDLFYVDNWSLSLDFAILVNTAHAVSVRGMRALLSRVKQR
jgi:exopolysaccharide biosynthesis polyprenyl glycosylphosphotransferase